MPGAGEISAGEAALVCSHYDIGVVHEVRAFGAGSRHAPKVVLSASTGDYLLKRRAPGRDDPARVALSHAVQIHLRSRGFPAAELIGTRRENNSMLQVGRRVYELFRYVHGTRSDASPDAAQQSGRALARLHRELTGYITPWPAATLTYHASKEVMTRLRAIPRLFHKPEARGVARTLRDHYAAAASHAEHAGIASMPPTFLHGDWHPGNLIFQDGRLAAVVDFDSVRVGPRVVDAAAGALHYAMRGFRAGGGDTGRDEAPLIGLDWNVMDRFLAGYDEGASPGLTAAEKAAMGWLMVEALIAESAASVAATGTVGRYRVTPFLHAVQRAAERLVENVRAGRITRG